MPSVVFLRVRQLFTPRFAYRAGLSGYARKMRWVVGQSLLLFLMAMIPAPSLAQNLPVSAYNEASSVPIGLIRTDSAALRLNYEKAVAELSAGAGKICLTLVVDNQLDCARVLFPSPDDTDDARVLIALRLLDCLFRVVGQDPPCPPDRPVQSCLQSFNATTLILFQRAMTQVEEICRSLLSLAPL